MPTRRTAATRLATCVLALSVVAPLALVAPAAAADDAVGPLVAADDAAAPSVDETAAGTVVLAVEVEAEADDIEVAELAEVAGALAEQAGGKVRVDHADSEVVSLEVPATEVDAVSDQLADVAAADDVRQPVEFTLWRTPNDSRFARQARHLRPIGVPRAWNRARGSASTRIAVVDSGVDVAHPDLAGKVVGRHNAVYGGRNVRDRDKHGTAVASIAAAATDNRRGIAGVGWNTSILAVKVADSRGQIWGDALAAGIRWSVRNGADVINLSLGAGKDDPFVRSAVAHAVSRGVVVVAAVSNSGSSTPTFPASYPGVLSVGATDGRALASFSDFGPGVDVGAPGVGLLAAVASGGYTRVDGTSFSAALVSGQAALLRAAKPRMAAARVTRIIERTARSVGSGDAAVDRVHVFDSVVRATGVPTRPRAVQAVARSAGVVVRWDPPAHAGTSPLTGYRIDVRPAGGTWRTAARVGPTRERVRVRGLTGDRRYQARVTPLSRVGTGVPATARPVRAR